MARSDQKRQEGGRVALTYFWHVDMLEQTIGLQVLVAFCIAELAVTTAPTCARNAGLGVDDNVAGRDQLVHQK